MKTNVQYENPVGACPAQGLYSHLARIKQGNLLFIAGQLSVGTDGGVVGAGNFDAQFQQVFKNLGAVLNGVGCDFNDVAKFTTYLVDALHIPNFMKCRAALFPSLFAGDLYAPNTLLVVNRLVKQEFLLEVEAVVRDRD